MLPEGPLEVVADHLSLRDFCVLGRCNRFLHHYLIESETRFRNILPDHLESLFPTSSPSRLLRKLRTLKGLTWAKLESESGANIPRAHLYPAVSLIEHTNSSTQGPWLVLFGGKVVGPRSMLIGEPIEERFSDECWAFNISKRKWCKIADHRGALRPGSRIWDQDGRYPGFSMQVGSRIVFAIHGGLRRAGYRDNQTWLLECESEPERY